MKYLLIFILAIMPSALYGATLGVSYDSASRNVLQTDLDYTGATANFTASLKVGSVDVVPDSRTVSAGAGMSGGGALSVNRTFTWDASTFVNNVTLWDGANASRTFTINLSGTDPVWTYTSGVANLSTGTLQYGGNTVATAANNLSFFAATTSDQFFGVISDEVGSSGTAIRVTGTASNGFVPVSNGAGVITWTAQSGSGSGAPVGTVVNTGTPAQYALPAYSDTTGTNVAPSKLSTDATGTNLYVGALIVTNSATIGSAAGVSITGTNGILTVLGLGDGQDENFVVDFNGTANTAVWTSTTGMATWDFGTSWVFKLGSIEVGHATDSTITRGGAGQLLVEGIEIVMPASTNTLTQKTYDAAAAGNVLKFIDYRDFVFPTAVDGAGTTMITNNYSSFLSGKAVSAGTGSTNANYALYDLGTVPRDIDTTVELVLKDLAIRVSGTDTDSATFTIGLWSPASSSAASPTDYTSLSTFISIASGTLTSPAAGDIFYINDTTLTGWAAAVTGGRPFIIGIARLDSSNDDSITIFGGSIQYTRTK